MPMCAALIHGYATRMVSDRVPPRTHTLSTQWGGTGTALENTSGFFRFSLGDLNWLLHVAPRRGLVLDQAIWGFRVVGLVPEYGVQLHSKRGNEALDFFGHRFHGGLVRVE